MTTHKIWAESVSAGEKTSARNLPTGDASGASVWTAPPAVEQTTGMFERAVDPPDALVTSWFRLEMLAPVHNERDHEAWMSSIEHIRATPGFAPPDCGSDDWPTPMTLDENLVDLDKHRDEFLAGDAFAYSVLDRDDVVGCVYIDPDKSRASDALVRSWVRASRADRDHDLAVELDQWLRDAWPIRSRRWPGRSTLGS